MDVVASVDVSDIPKDVKSVRKWANDKLRATGYKVDRQNFGTIIFDDSHINIALNHILHKPNEMGAVIALPKVLKRGIIIDSHENHKTRLPDSFTIAAPIEVNGIRGNMGVVVQRATKNFYHAHRLLLPDGSAFKFDMNKKTESKPAGELPEDQALIAKPIDSVDNKIADSQEKIKRNISSGTRRIRHWWQYTTRA